jgi:hypothetical protein
MIKNFTELRKQLEELSSVINSFKSEAVQLRIVELIFTGEAESEAEEPRQDDSESTTSSGKRRGGRRRAPAKKVDAKSTKGGIQKKATRGGRKGPATILGELIDEGFFQKKRTIGDVIQHTSSQKARTFRANELSGPLGRFVRDKRLKRDKNADGQYEYQKP